MKQPFRLISLKVPIVLGPEPVTIRAGILQGRRLKLRLSSWLEVTGIFVFRTVCACAGLGPWGSASREAGAAKHQFARDQKTVRNNPYNGRGAG